MKGSWIIWFLLMVDLIFIGLIAYFGQDSYTPEQNWYSFATLLLYRIVALWVTLLGISVRPVQIKRWEIICFSGYVFLLIAHSVFWSIQITQVIWGK